MKDLGAYRACMSTGLKGKKITDPLERKKAFCALAKQCSGKSKDMAEAEKLCKASHPEWYGGEKKQG